MIKDRRQAVFPYLTESERVVLAVLDGQALRGLDIVKNSGGLLKRGSIYEVLQGMEERGGSYFAPCSEDVQPLVWSWEDEGEISGLPRKVYQGTGAGYYWFGRYLRERSRT